MKEGYPTNQNIETNQLKLFHKKPLRRLLYKSRHLELAHSHSFCSTFGSISGLYRELAHDQ